MSLAMGISSLTVEVKKIKKRIIS
uniref:Uncharacterized protein n=1 Tax=Anguilla anguilla TaxID=7936 RepID=A0A0E9QRV1_ANGAN